MANLKNVIYLSNEDYETLVSTGTVTIDGETLTYDENNVYITPDKLASSTEDGLMSASDKAKLDSFSPSSNYVTLDTTQTITGGKTFTGSSIYFNGGYTYINYLGVNSLNAYSSSSFSSTATFSYDVKIGYQIYPTSTYDASTGNGVDLGLSDYKWRDLYLGRNLTDGTNTISISEIGTVKSVRVQAGTGLSSSQSTAQTSSLNTTISIASGYKLPTNSQWNTCIKDVSLSGTTLTFTKNDNSTIVINLPAGGQSSGGDPNIY